MFCGVEPLFKKYLDTIEFLDVTASNQSEKWENFIVNYGEKITWPLL